MQLTTENARPASAANLVVDELAPERDAAYANYKIIRRNGAVVGFEPPKIAVAMTKAFLAVNGGQGAASARVREQVANLTDSVVHALMRRQPSGGSDCSLFGRDAIDGRRYARQRGVRARVCRLPSAGRARQ